MAVRGSLIALAFVLAQILTAGHAQADGISGSLPPSGVALATWDGGTVTDLPTLNPSVTSVWVASNGSMVGYLVGAPDFVNKSFLSLYPQGVVPSSTGLLVTTSSDAAPVGGPPPTASPTPSATPTPAPLVIEVAAHFEYTVNAELSGFTATSSTGVPLAPARSECSAAPASFLGWGWPDGAQVTVVGVGSGACVGWTYLYNPNSASNYWLESRFVTTTPPAQVAPGGDPTVTPPPGLGSEIHTCINGTFEGWSGETVFELCNGQVWAQSSFGYTYHYAYRPDVTLTQTASGWVMSVDGVSSTISVVQVSFERTCIDGTFEGWSGDTIFTLCNGQVWQQAEFNFSYHYAYRPSVLIYQSPFGGYRMSVDGVADSIRVRRLQ